MGLDRELLADIGFVSEKGFGGEVWVYDGMFYVYFDDIDFQFTDGVDGRIIDRVLFFKQFMDAIKEDIRMSFVEYPEGW